MTPYSRAMRKESIMAQVGDSFQFSREALRRENEKLEIELRDLPIGWYLAVSRQVTTSQGFFLVTLRLWRGNTYDGAVEAARLMSAITGEAATVYGPRPDDAEIQSNLSLQRERT